MNRLLAASAILLLAAGPGLSADALWDSAVRLFARDHALYATRIRTDVNEYDGRGNLRVTRQTEIEVRTDAGGVARSRLVWVRENGRDLAVADAVSSASEAVTPDSADPSREGQAAAMAVLELSPFDPELQSQIELLRINGNAAPRAEYRYTLQRDQLSVHGTAWLDARDGTPVRLMATVAPLPRFVRQMTVEQHFTRSSLGWHTSRVNISAEGGFLFVRRRIEITMQFLDHADSRHQIDTGARP